MPIAEFDVPKSNPQAIIRLPFIREGDTHLLGYS